MAPPASKLTPSTSTSDDKDDFTWDHSVLTLRRFLIRLTKFLNAHPKFKSYAMGNFCSTHGGRTAVYSDEHAAQIQADKVRGLGFSMEKPMPAGQFKRTNTPLDATRVANYTISPETLIDCMETFLTEILDRMEDSGSAEEYRKLCSGDPTTLLSMLDDEANAINETQSQKAEEARDRIIDSGFASADVPTFNLWKTAVDNLNKTVRHNERLDETKLLARYIKGVKKFGKAIAKDLKDEIRHLKGDGNTLLTLRAIRTILGDADADGEDADVGKARQADGGREKRSNRTGANDTRERRDQGASLRPRLRASSRHRLPSDFLRYAARHVASSAVLSRRSARTLDAPMGFRLRVPPRRAIGERSSLLSDAAWVRDGW